MRVLAIGAHPDDIELACSGTLAKCVKRGDTVIVCHVSSGNLGHVVIPPDELQIIRANEAKNAGNLAGIEVIWGGFHDLDIYDNNKEARDKIVDIIKYADPDFIITHSPDDYMPDHTAVSRLVFDASFTATLPNYKTMYNKPAKLVPIYYMDTLSGINFNPTEYVDISEENITILHATFFVFISSIRSYLRLYRCCWRGCSPGHGTTGIHWNFCR